MTTTQISKGDRVEIEHQSGTEYGVCTSVINGQVDVHLDDDTHCWFPVYQVRKAA